jgi:hypothetical protein
MRGRVRGLLDDLSLADQSNRRNSQTLLIDLGHAARRHFADVRMVRDVAHEQDQLAVVEDGRQQRDLGRCDPRPADGSLETNMSPG